MAKTSFQIEQEFINNINSITGNDLKSWLKIIGETSLSKRNEILNWLKSEHNFRHQDASLLAGIYVNDGKPVYADSGDLLENQFNKKEHLRALYDTLMETIVKRLPNTRVEAKKTYVSLNAKREYAAIGIKSKEIRLAMDLDGEPNDGDFVKQTGIGCMPRISHMIKLTDASQITDNLLDKIEKAYKRME
ncbi:DUF5655 domain-containing protein [Aquimarina sp. M1]